MPTAFEAFFAELTRPFRDFKTRPQGGRQLKYITARQVANRLDDVAGPENWWDDYSPGAHGIICRLTLRLPDGQEITKVDAGGAAGMQDEGDDEKSAYSDAFKRAAVKFGVGRELYGDGVPNYAPKQEARPTPQQPRREAPAAREERSIEPAREPQGEAPTPPGGDGGGDKPGLDLFKWAKDHDRLKDFTTWAKDHGVKGLMKEWDRDVCNRAWEACGGTK